MNFTKYKMNFVTGWLEEKATGYLKTGIQAGGTLAGNAVGGVGGLIENSGRAVGEGSKFWLFASQTTKL